ncbi:MAG: hypothetical protein IIC04_02235 [Proteobacteria bacterium]|nr:hypothetical protein [Pseudomonadota bacterium]
MKEGSRRNESLKASLRKGQRSKKARRTARMKKQVVRAREQVRTSSPWKFLLSVAGVMALVGGGIWAFSALTPHLPPTEISGHTEDLPGGHILSTHMPEPIQRHMLEHADGKDTPGVIVQYNCEDYVCEPGLVESLETLVRRYGTYVYLAPNDYDGKIILTKRGALEILEGVDKSRIERFIQR